jgi:hypothetical protein
MKMTTPHIYGVERLSYLLRVPFSEITPHTYVGVEMKQNKLIIIPHVCGGIKTKIIDYEMIQDTMENHYATGWVLYYSTGAWGVSHRIIFQFLQFHALDHPEFL